MGCPGWLRFNYWIKYKFWNWTEISW
jgi:hypothetical protein